MTTVGAASPDTTLSKTNLIVLLTALLLGWFGIPLIVGAPPEIVFLVIVALIIFVLRLLDRRNALWAIIGLVIGILIALLLPQISSSGIAGDQLVRSFLVLWLVFLV